MKKTKRISNLRNSSTAADNREKSRWWPADIREEGWLQQWRFRRHGSIFSQVIFTFLTNTHSQTVESVFFINCVFNLFFGWILVMALVRLIEQLLKQGKSCGDSIQNCFTSLIEADAVRFIDGTKGFPYRYRGAPFLHCFLFLRSRFR